MTYFWNFETPPLSQEQLELETWCLAGRFITRGTNEIKAEFDQLGSEKGSCNLVLKFCDSLRILGTVGARNVKFGMQNNHQGYKRNKCDIEIWGPLRMSGTAGARNVKFACQFITGGTNEINAKFGQMGCGRGHVTYFWNFVNPSISQERKLRRVEFWLAP